MKQYRAVVIQFAAGVSEDKWVGEWRTQKYQALQDGKEKMDSLNESQEAGVRYVVTLSERELMTDELKR